MPSNRFSMSNMFGPANESVARISQICKGVRERNREDMQQSTFEVREGPIKSHSAPRAKGKPQSQAPLPAASRPSLAWDAKQDVKDRYEAGEIKENEAILKLQDLGMSCFDAMDFLDSWSDRS